MYATEFQTVVKSCTFRFNR